MRSEKVLIADIYEIVDLHNLGSDFVDTFTVNISLLLSCLGC